MRPSLCGLICVTSLIYSAARCAEAQEFRVYTRVSRVSKEAGADAKPHIQSRTLTLFHAGRVYDYVDQAQEVTIVDLAAKRCTILHESRRLATEVTQDEVRRYIALAEEEAGKLLRDMQRSNAPRDRIAAQTLNFQLSPEFEVKRDGAVVSLTSPRFSYRAVTMAPETPEAAATYWAFADWIARLNSVLHPHSFLPEPRLRLNQELATAGLLARTVELNVIADRELVLRAEHEFGMELTANDRQYIHHWNTLLQSKDTVTHVPFPQFQQQLLSSRSPK